jgi:hypothetical protein
MTSSEQCAFTRPTPSIIASDEGWQVKLLGVSSVLYSESGRSMKIESELLGMPAGLALYTHSIQHWLPPHEGEPVDEKEKARIVENIRQAYRFDGCDIHVY